jgi:hypothetical protein
MFGLLAGLGLLGFLVVQSAKNNASKNTSPWLAYNTDRTQEFNVFRGMMADPWRYSLGDFAQMVDYMATLGFIAEADMLADFALRLSNEAEMELAKQKLGQPYYLQRIQFLDQNPRIFATYNLRTDNALPSMPFVPTVDANYGPTFDGVTSDPIPYQNLELMQRAQRAYLEKIGLVPDTDMAAAAKKAAEG